MAEILSHASTTIQFDPRSSPLQSAVDSTGSVFVDTPGQPHQLSITPPDLALPDRLRLPNSLDPTNDNDDQSFDVSKGHSRKHKSLALPAFSFNPSASLDAGNENISPPLSPKSPGLSASPSKRKHRRIRSELVGGDSRHQSPVASSGANVDKITEELAKRETLEPSMTSLPLKGHRHRRSGAVSSKDLSAIQRPGSSGTGQDVSQPASGPPTPTLGSQFVLPAIESPRSSPVSVSFSESVEVIPRRSLPALKVTDRASVSRPIHSSDGAETKGTLSPSEYLESIRPATVAPTLSRPSRTAIDPFPSFDNISENLSEESLISNGDFPSVSIVEDASDDAATLIDHETMTLDEDFDNDPTAAIIVSEHSNSQPSSPKSPKLDLDSPKASGDVIDLDSANDVIEAIPMTADELRNLRAKSFSAARHSMHSGGMDAATARLNHRRTESVPSMAITFFERPPMPRNDSQTASERGFEMNNVFEEEEEEMQVAVKADEEQSELESGQRLEQYGLGLGLQHKASSELTPSSVNEAPCSAYDEASGQDLDDDIPTPTNDLDIPSRSHTIRYASSNPQSVVCTNVDALEESRDRGEETYELRHPTAELEVVRPATAINQRPASQPLPYLTAPPWNTQAENSSFGSTPQELSTSSAWSTPKLDTAATSLHEAHLGLPRSNVDGVSLSTEGIPSGIPSLVSSMSTMSCNHRYAGSTASPSTPGGTQAEDATNNMSSQQEKRRKRSSIQSLSQLLGYSASAKSNLSVAQSSRCQTSSGLSNNEVETPVKEKRRKRLSRALKFWKPKDGSSPG